jgi:membrane carboxypeptidase/penicillin-binding protein PbpC
MRAALAGKPVTSFAPPPGLDQAEVCVPSGQLPTPLCPRTRLEWFLEGTVPAEPDTLYRQFVIDARTGGLADANTPPEAQVTQVFMQLPPQAREWAAQNGIPQPPAAGLAANDGSPAPLQLSSPDPQTVYQLTPRLPRESQKIPLRVVARPALSEVTYFLNGQPAGTATASPFEVWWILEPGTFTLEARARLTNGAIVTSAPLQFVVYP